MRFLLDEMHAPAVAVRLHDLGHDASAVKERSDLMGLPDEELLTATTADRRALVTENVKDFAVIDKRWAAAGKGHRGMVFTHRRRFPRAAPGYVEALALSLASLVDHHPALEASGSYVWWLAAPAPTPRR